MTAFNLKFKVGDRVRFPGRSGDSTRTGTVAEAYRVYSRLPRDTGRRFTAYRLEHGTALLDEDLLTLAPPVLHRFRVTFVHEVEAASAEQAELIAAFGGVSEVTREQIG